MNKPTEDHVPRPKTSGISLFESILVDIGDPYAPPTDVLRVNVIGDSVSLTIAKHDEDAKKSTYTDVAGICVDLHTLTQLLVVARGDDERSKHRQLDEPCYTGLARTWSQTL